MSSKIVLPNYITHLPSTGKSVQFRPFSVKEEKALLLALQEDNIETLAATIKNLISICTQGNVDPENTPYYDLEYLFLQIRAKSIGEMVDLIGTCDCGPDKKTEFSVDIESVFVEPIPNGNATIKIPDSPYFIEIRHPSIDNFVQTLNNAGEDATSIVANCIISIYTDDETMNWSFDEKLTFVDSMTTRQQKDISIFLKTMPMVKLPTPYTCKHCSKSHSNHISGFENFFV